MPHNLHHFTCLTTLTYMRYFALLYHLHGLLTRYFYDFNCRLVCCKVSGAEIYAP